METTWKPLTKSEYIIWKCETLEKIEEEFPEYAEDEEKIANYFNAVENLIRRKVERTGGKFTDFE